MNDQTDFAAAETPRTPGAKRARPGEYYFDLAKLDPIMGGPDYSSVFGACVEGERMIVALMRMPAGTGSEPHSHPNEQWVYILEGTMDWVVNGVSRLVRSGSAIYIPADTIHHAKATPEVDVVFFTVKDASHGLHGIKAKHG
jgi:quercetin dioxygenase-like cupin family protein